MNVLNTKLKLRAKELGDDLDRRYQSINQSISGQNSKIKRYSFIDRIEQKGIVYFKLSNNGKLFITEGKIENSKE